MTQALVAQYAAARADGLDARRHGGDSAVDDFHGTKVPDPYRWLEELDSPETVAWVKAEARLTDSYLEKIPNRGAIKKRLAELLDFEKFGLPFHKGGRYFYSHNSGEPTAEHSLFKHGAGRRGIRGPDPESNRNQ